MFFVNCIDVFILIRYEEIVKINNKLLHSKTYKSDYNVFLTISL